MDLDRNLQTIMVRLAGDAAGVSARAAQIAANGIDPLPEAPHSVETLESLIVDLQALLRVMEETGLIQPRIAKRAAAYQRALSIVVRGAGAEAVQ